VKNDDDDDGQQIAFYLTALSIHSGKKSSTANTERGLNVTLI
jgi:hypothetical protein